MMSQLGSTIGKSHLKDGLVIISCLQDLGKNIGRSPAHSHSPAQNHVSAASSANQSPAGRWLVLDTIQFGSLLGPWYKSVQINMDIVGSLNTSLSSQTQSPDARGGGATAVTSSPSSNTSQVAPGSMLTETQRQHLLIHHQQQQLAALGHNLTVSKSQN